jgi:hypothetical protein
MAAERRVVVKPLEGVDRAGGLTRILIGATLIPTSTAPAAGFTEVLCVSCGKVLQVDTVDFLGATEPAQPSVGPVTNGEECTPRRLGPRAT